MRNNQVYDLGVKKSYWYGGFSAFVSVLLYSSIAGIICVSAQLYKHGLISVGAISAFLLYMIYLLMNFGILASVFGNVMSVLGASDKIVALMQH